MKRLLLITLAIAINLTTFVNAQNLVVNGSFENYNALPQGTSEWYKCDDWNNVSLNTAAVYTNATPDYYNAQQVFPWASRLPQSDRGYLNAHTGDAIMGFITYNSAGVTGPAFREYISSQLTSPLVAGETYTVSFWLSNAQDTLQRRYGSQTDGIGVHFSAAPLSQPANQVINVTPQLVIPGLVWNTEWTLYSFTYTPIFEYQYITIGSFDDDASQTRSVVDDQATTESTAYYFIDDVVVEVASSNATGIDTQTACESYTWINGVTYTASNNSATHTLVGEAASGGDSIVTLDLTIIYPSSGIDMISTCGSHTWIDGITYSSDNNSATYTIAGGSANGCDSIVTLDLTINSAAYSVDIHTACEEFTWINGIEYTESNNTSTHTIIGGAANGCDSIITLGLTILTPGLSIDMITAEESYIWIDGITYTESNNTATFIMDGAAANGCDSIIVLDLIIDSPEEACISNTVLPNVFTPNSDQINDEFNINFECDVTEFKIHILNRWGNIVFESDAPNFIWDGKSNGNDCSEGVYFYTISYFVGETSFQESTFLHLNR